eukprot:scaffold39748_cov22-Tisochrysis_lutea.AAC.1
MPSTPPPCPWPAKVADSCATSGPPLPLLLFLFPVALAAPVAVAIFATALCPARGVCGRPQDAQQLAVQLRRLPVARFAAVAILVGAVPKAAMA